MKKSIKILTIIFSTFILSKVLAQTNLTEIENDIKSELGAKYGQIYDVGEIENVNQDIGKYRDFKFPITDPFGTLKDCYIFTAYVPEGGLVGVYKNGIVLWDSGPIIRPGVGQDIFGTQDLNNDGSVDIILSFYYGMRNSSQSIWIFDWDGQNGSLLNETNPYGDWKESVIFSYNWFTDIFDVNGDEILEIKGQDEDTRATKVYSWNGSKYGDYGLQMPQYIPMNLLTAKVSCRVGRSEYGLLYNYSVSNDSLSRQPIWLFAVYRNFENSFANSGVPNIKWTQRYPENLVQWDVSNDPNKYPFDYIYPHEKRTNFKLETDAQIIYIDNFYIQGVNGKRIPDNNYILENSLKGKTLCGKFPSDLFIPLNFIDSLINYNQNSFNLGWIKNLPTADKYSSYFTTAKIQLQQNNIAAVKNILNQVLLDVDRDSTSNLSSEAYALLRYNTEYLLNNLPEVTPGFAVKLTNSSGSLLPGGSLKYYERGWKDAVDNGDGTFVVSTDKQTVSLRMTYEYGSQTVSNVPAQNNSYTFQTINTTLQLKNSSGNLINEEGVAKYYAGGWRDFGSIVNGTISKELLPGNYTFRMTYAYSSNDKQQNISTNSTVVFQTVNAAVQLKNSHGQLIDEGTVKYYAGGWRDFGSTINGVASKELLPGNYSFRMIYAYASNDKQQNIGDNPTIVFQTVNANVQLQNSQGQLIDEGVVKYYAGGWKDFGPTVNGIAAKELLPNNYSFRMTYAYANNDKQQNIGTNPTILFQTVNSSVQLKNSRGQLIDEGTVKYYARGWRDFGSTVNGAAAKELLPNNYSFRMTYEYISNDKQQNIGSNNIVNFSTVLCAVKINSAQNQPVDNAEVKYYAGGWRQFGLTSNGEALKELLPSNITFRGIYNGVSKDKRQNTGESQVIEIFLP